MATLPPRKTPRLSPRQFIEQEKAEYLDDALPRMSLEDKSRSDQLHADFMRMAEHVRLNGRSDGFASSVLLACNVLDWLADSLRTTDASNKEIGARYIEEAALRLRLLGLWGEEGNCKRRISLKEMNQLVR